MLYRNILLSTILQSFQILEIWLNFKFNFAYDTRVTGWKQFYYY